MDFQDVRVKWTKIGDFISSPRNQWLGAGIARLYKDCIGVRGSIDWQEEEIRREADFWRKVQEILPEEMKFAKEEIDFLINGKIGLSTFMVIQFDQSIVHSDFCEIENKFHELK